MQDFQPWQRDFQACVFEVLGFRRHKYSSDSLS
jgi:hypothetical protein